MSAKASGPMGWLVPSFMPASMSSGVAKPSANTKNASLIMGIKMRLTTKPGAFLTVMGVLPKRSAMALTASCVASLVCRPRMISTSAIMGTGLKKCMPMKRSARCVDAASLVMEIELVLVATITSAPNMPSSCCRILTFSGSFSVAASITICADFKASYCVLVWMRASAADFSASVSFSFLIRRSKLPAMVARPFCKAASLMSIMTTEKPLLAQAWAMPLPMVPEPMMPMV